MPFFKKKHKDHKQGQRKPPSPRLGAEKDESRKRYSVNIEELRGRDSRSPTPSASMYEMGNSSSLGRSNTTAAHKPRTELARETSATIMSRKRAFFEDIVRNPSASGASVNAVGRWSPEKKQGVNTTESPSRSSPMIPNQSGVGVSITSPASTFSGQSYTSHHPPSCDHHPVSYDHHPPSCDHHPPSCDHHPVSYDHHPVSYDHHPAVT